MRQRRAGKGSFRRAIRRRSRFYIGLSLAAAVALLVVPAASSDIVGSFTAAVNPDSAVAGTAETFTVKLTNCDPAISICDESSPPLGSADISVPTGTGEFTSVSAVVPETESGWTVDVVDGVNAKIVQLRSEAGSELPAGGEVKVDISATAPEAANSYDWTVVAKPTNDFSGTDDLGQETVTITVTGPLDHFKLSDSTNPDDPIDTQTAGDPFTVYATAYDASENVIEAYPGDGDSQTFSGLANSPLPSNTPPSYGAITWGSGTGQGSASITAFKAGSSLTLTDTATGKTGTSTFTVTPGDLYRFAWTDQPNAGQTAGATFDSAAVTAYDAWDNVKTDYPGVGDNPVFSGLNRSPTGCNPDHVTLNPAGTDGCDPIYGFTWSSGVATSTTVKDYKAETVKLKVTDTTPEPDIFAESSQFTVASAGLDHFTVPTPGTQKAGTSFNVTVKARDAFGNAASGWTSTNGCVVFSGPFNSPPPAETPPSYPAPGSCVGSPDYSQLSFDASGDTTAAITLFRATTAQTVPSTQTLTVKDAATQTKQGSTGGFTVNPGDLYRFRWTDQPGATQTAGIAFDRLEATAYDQWDNIKTDYNPASAVFSGLSQSSRGCTADNTTVNSAGTFACNPIYNLSFVNGIANSTTTKDYKAETTQLTVTDGSISASTDSTPTGTPDTFIVGPNEPDFIAFVQQPTLTQVSTAIAPDVTVKVEDAFGNATPTKPVTMIIATGFNPSGGNLTGGGPFNTDASGIATFSNLKIDKSGIGYKLNAAVPTTYSSPSTRNVNSDFFDIANDVNTCTGSCSATGDTANNSATVDAFGLGGGAFSSRMGPLVSALVLDARIGMTVANSVRRPTAADTGAPCGASPNLGDGFWVTTFPGTSTSQPSYKVVARLDKLLVKPAKTAASKYDICLGAINVNHPPTDTTPGNNAAGDCTNPTTSKSWPTKDGCAKFFNGYYWGLVRDYPSSQVNNQTGCPGSSTFPPSFNANLFPGVYKKQKNGAGDVVVTFCKPYPWDGGGGFR